MKKAGILLFIACGAGTVLMSAGLQAAATSAEKTARGRQQPAQAKPTLATNVDQEINAVEKLIVEASEAMPEQKFNFSPEGLSAPGSNYQGVRSFAGQIKHIAASNWLIWSALTGDALPEGLKDGSGPANLQSKTEILTFLKESFVLGHKAAATLTPENMLERPGSSKSTRLHLAEFGVAHAYDHYGQMIEYLRMNGIVPPASRPKAE
jgi:DinB family protein